MKNSTEVIGLPIMCVTEGQECGKVMDIVIDPQKKPSGLSYFRARKTNMISASLCCLT